MQKEEFFTQSLINYWIKKGHSKDVVQKYADELYLIEWMFDHVNFWENFENFKEGCIKYFLDDGAHEETLIDYFSIEWKTEPNEIKALIDNIKREP